MSSAAFLAYLVEKYDPKIVLELNRSMRAGTYKADLFRELTGKTIDDLGKEWRTKLQEDERARSARDRQSGQSS